MDELSERIEACIAVENTSAEIYNALSNKFPKAKIFFRELSKDEESHATLLIVGKAYHRIGKLPEHVVPSSLPDIFVTLDLAEKIKQKIDSDEISLKEALEMALLLENSTAESYLQEIMSIQTDDKVIANLKKMLIDEISHSEKIKEFKQSAGL
jgi:rubrerythrin